MKPFQLSQNVDKNKIFILDKSELGQQFAPHFYRAEYADLLDRLRVNPCKKLGDIALFSKETWKKKDSSARCFPYVEISGIDTLTGRIRTVRQLPVSGAPNRARMRIRTGDILIAKTRPSKAAIALVGPEHDGYIASTGFSIIREIKDSGITREFLYIALRQPFCLMQLKQYSGDRNYAAISKKQLSDILIPHLDLPSQRSVVASVQQAYAIQRDKERKAADLLASIDDYLVESLGISLPERRDQLRSRIFTVPYNQLASGRFDANYSRPLFRASCAAISQGKFEALSLKRVARAIFQGVGKRNSDGGDYALLKVKNIKEGGAIDLGSEAFVNEVPPQKVLIEGDILAPFVGEAVRLHRFSVYPQSDCVRHTVDNNTGVIRLKSGELNPHFAASFLSSSLGKRQIDQRIGGGVIPLLGPHHARELLIPVPPLEKQNEIADHIGQLRREIEQLHQEGEAVLERASYEVEQLVLNPQTHLSLAVEEGLYRGGMEA